MNTIDDAKIITDDDKNPNLDPESERVMAQFDTNKRKRECEAAIQEVLAEYRCRIVPMLTGKQVISDGAPTEMLMGATYHIMPETAE